jgi:hypothetical protein
MNFLFVRGDLKSLIKLYKKGNLTKENSLISRGYGFCFAIESGHLNVCIWLCETFQITKEDMLNYEWNLLYSACIKEDYKIISFLCNKFGFSIEDTDCFIQEIPEEKREKIFECLTPIGSFTKPSAREL